MFVQIYFRVTTELTCIAFLCFRNKKSFQNYMCSKQPLVVIVQLALVKAWKCLHFHPNQTAAADCNLEGTKSISATRRPWVLINQPTAVIAAVGGNQPLGLNLSLSDNTNVCDAFVSAHKQTRQGPNCKQKENAKNK